MYSVLSVFPTLLSWSQVSPLLIRLAIGLVFIHWAWKAYKKSPSSGQDKTVGAVEFVAGVLLVIGLYTQIAALVAGIDLVVRLIERVSKRAFLTDGVNYYLLLLIMAVSLMVTGPGFWSFDYPL